MKHNYCLIAVLLLSIFSAKAGVNGSLEFIQNRGQWDGGFTYKTTTNKGDIFLLPDQFVYVLADDANIEKIEARHHGLLLDPQVLRYHEYRMYFEGATRPLISGSDSLASYYNYFLGSDKTHWQSGIHPCKNVDYKGVYNGIDMHISSSQGAMKYDFIVQPGANPSQIRLRFDGADDLTINEKGDLIIATSVGAVTELKPYAYQVENGQKIEVPCRYFLNGKTVTFSLPRGYSAARQLIIDPTVVFATFTGSTADNLAYTAAYDKHGNFYAAGIAHSAGFPASPGAFQVSFNGGTTATGIGYESDIAIFKFSSDGINRIWATYLGGSDNEAPHSLIVDSNDRLLVLGKTYSSNYPHTTGAFDTSYNGGADLVLTKFDSSCTGLDASTFLGGSSDDGVSYDAGEYMFGHIKYNFHDDTRSEVLMDDSENIYVAACTKSMNFPTTPNATRNGLYGSQDAVLCKLNSTLDTLLWSTYFGGYNYDAAYSLALDFQGKYIYVSGGTDGTGLSTTSGVIDTSYQGGRADGFIARFRNGGNYELQRATYIGTQGYDQCFGLQTDLNGNVYATGQTLGGHFPVTAGVYSNSGSSQFIMKLDSNLATNIFSTVYGSGDSLHTNITPTTFFVDSCENIYAVGWGGRIAGFLDSAIGNVGGMPITPNAIQTTTDSNDFYFIVLSQNAQSLLYGSYMGAYGGVVDHLDGGTSRFDKNCVLYQAVCGACGHGTFPTSPPNVWSLEDSSFNCNQVALKIAFNIAPVICGDTTTDTVINPNRVNSVAAKDFRCIITPNPNNGQFILSSSAPFNNAQLSIYNAIGQKILDRRVSGTMQQISLPPTPGIYFAEVRAGGMIWRQKIIVE